MKDYISVKVLPSILKKKKKKKDWQPKGSQNGFHLQVMGLCYGQQ